MNTQELEDALESDKIVNNYFLKVYAFNQLPQQKQAQDLLILISNCCPSFKRDSKMLNIKIILRYLIAMDNTPTFTI